jgi:hypothetical protein
MKAIHRLLTKTRRQISSDQLDDILSDAVLLAAAYATSDQHLSKREVRFDLCIHDSGQLTGPTIKPEVVLVKGLPHGYEETPQTKAISQKVNDYMSQRLEGCHTNQISLLLLSGEISRHRQEVVSPDRFSSHQLMKALTNAHQ